MRHFSRLRSPATPGRRIIQTYRDDDTEPKERFVYHAAGVGGLGGGSYIDSVVMRDRDNTSAWYAAADGSLETRVYYCQNWRADVVATLGPDDASTGIGLQVLERVKYDSYGRPRLFPIADFNHDGSYTSGSGTPGTDDYAYTHASSPATDINFDGADTVEDTLTYAAATAADPTNNRKLYAGYEWDPVLAPGTADAGVYHVRNRVLLSELGRWSRRDPVGYVDDVHLAAYLQCIPIRSSDPTGMCRRCSSTFDSANMSPPAPRRSDGVSMPQAKSVLPGMSYPQFPNILDPTIPFTTSPDILEPISRNPWTWTPIETTPVLPEVTSPGIAEPVIEEVCEDIGFGLMRCCVFVATVLLTCETANAPAPFNDLDPTGELDPWAPGPVEGRDAERCLLERDFDYIGCGNRLRARNSGCVDAFLKGRYDYWGLQRCLDSSNELAEDCRWWAEKNYVRCMNNFPRIKDPPD